VVTGAADDDPSGIVTYSMAGAQLGTSLLWTSLLTWPLMCAVQMMCARIGMVSGSGLAGALRKKFPKPILLVIGLALFVANTINIGADLSGMADVSQLLTGIPAYAFVVLFGIAITVATIRFPYAAIASILKWLCLVLFAYIITAFLVHPDWPQVLKVTFVPSWPTSHSQWSMLVAILGTTISPYLFFWQASQEIEEEKAKGHRTEASRRGATHIADSKDAVQALTPLAGRFAGLLFATGLIGVGFLAIPTLAGSAAYAFTETFGFRQGLNVKMRRARAFYGVLALAILLGMALTFTTIKPVDALYYTAIINGILAPFLLVGILIVACDKAIMQGQPSSMLGRIVVGVTTIGMFAAAAALFVL